MQHEPDHNGYLTKKEVAQRLKRTPRTIEIWARKWGLPHIKVGRSVLYSWPDIQKYLDDSFAVRRRPQSGFRPWNRGKYSLLTSASHIKLVNDNGQNGGMQS